MYCSHIEFIQIETGRIFTFIHCVAWDVKERHLSRYKNKSEWDDDSRRSSVGVVWRNYNYCNTHLSGVLFSICVFDICILCVCFFFNGENQQIYTYQIHPIYRSYILHIKLIILMSMIEKRISVVVFFLYQYEFVWRTVWYVCICYQRRRYSRRMKFNLESFPSKLEISMLRRIWHDSIKMCVCAREIKFKRNARILLHDT